MGNTLVLIFIIPFIDKNLSPLTRYSRMLLIHRINSARNAILPFLNPRPKGMDADSKALEEMISLYHPPISLSDNLTDNEIKQFRYHSKKMLTGLHPARSPSCRVEYHIFQYDNNRVNMYSIQHDRIDQWKTSNKPLILYFHGGGFVFGGIETYSGFECHLSKHLDMLVLHVDFGFAPDYSLSNILKDVIGVYKVLLQVDPNIHRRLIGMGDSSGGMLWIYLLQWIVSNKKSVPLGVVLHSPWPDLYFTHITFFMDTNIYLTIDLVFGLRQLAIGRDTDWYKLTDEEKSQLGPKKDSFEGFPPLYITAGTNEIFINDIRMMTDKARLAGVKVILDEGEGLMHTYALFHLWSSKARCIQGKIRQWIREQLLMDVQLTWNIKKQSEFSC
jgi:acetyl esterase/lipase